MNGKGAGSTSAATTREVFYHLRAPLKIEFGIVTIQEEASVITYGSEDSSSFGQADGMAWHGLSIGHAARLGPSRACKGHPLPFESVFGEAGPQALH